MEGKLAVAFLSIFVEFLPFTNTFHLLLKKYDLTKLIFLIITDKERERVQAQLRTLLVSLNVFCVCGSFFTPLVNV